MPTINQLIRKGRKASQNVSKSPALNRGYNSLQSNKPIKSTKTWSLYSCWYYDT